MDAKKIAHVRLTEAAGSRPTLDIVVPRGTTIGESKIIIGRLDNIIERLTGCPCISGLDVRFRDFTVHEDLKSFDERVDLH